MQNGGIYSEIGHSNRFTNKRFKADADLASISLFSSQNFVTSRKTKTLRPLNAGSLGFLIFSDMNNSLTVQNIKEYYKANKLVIPQNTWPNDVNRALTFLNYNIFETEMTIQLMRLKCKIPQKNFSGRFKHFIGKTPASYLKYHRIKCSKVILSDKRISCEITAISIELGYRRLTTFYSAFKEVVGMPPKQFVIKSKKK